jgi:hypothetical protein
MAENVPMPKGELIEEHKELVKTLRSRNPEKLEIEAKKQNRELHRYKATQRKPSGR